jgi:hypothetical protein
LTVAGRRPIKKEDARITGLIGKKKIAQAQEYRNLHREQIAAKKRVYDHVHRAEILERKRKSNQIHREVIAAKKRTYRHIKREYLARQARTYRERHIEEISARERAYRGANQEKVTALKRAWYLAYLANREASKAARHRRRRCLRNAEGSFTADDIIEIYDKQAGCCRWCSNDLNGRYHIDHIIPISRFGIVM